MRWLAMLAVSLVVGSCVSKPGISRHEATEEVSGNDALGYVTYSTPLFTPLDDTVQGNKRLRFGDLRGEQALADALQTPAFGISRVDYSLLQAALAARVAGTRVSSSTTDSTETTSGGAPTEGTPAEGTPTESSKSEKTTSFQSPEVPTAPGFPEIDATVLEKMVKLLDRSGTKFALPPDVLSTLVAANKTYMVNLEEYFNVEGFDFLRGLGAEYLPYKVHFTVTAEPGWYSRYQQFDAVLELTWEGRKPDSGALPEFMVLTVAPLETAETLDEFAAALNQVAIALSVEGAFRGVAAAGSLNRLDAAAKRLEGIRAGKTSTVAFHGTNQIRIRFQAAATGQGPGRDLQPVARVFTAIVLVRNRGKGGTSLSMADRWKKGREFQGVELVEKERVAEAVASDVGQEAASALQGLARRVPIKAAEQAAEQSARVAREAGAALGLARQAFQQSGGDSERRQLRTAETAAAAAERASQRDQKRLDALRDVQRILTQPEVPVSVANEAIDRLEEHVSSKHLPEEATKARAVLKQVEAAKARLDETARQVRQYQNDFQGRAAHFTGAAYFTPSVWNPGGKWAPPRNYLLWTSRPDRRYVADGPGKRDSWVPAWRGPLAKRLTIRRAEGFYRARLAELTVREGAVAKCSAEAKEAGETLKKQLEAVAKPLQDLKTAQETQATAEATKVDTLKTQYLAEAKAELKVIREEIWKAQEERAAWLRKEIDALAKGEPSDLTQVLVDARARAESLRQAHAGEADATAKALRATAYTNQVAWVGTLLAYDLKVAGLKPALAAVAEAKSAEKKAKAALSAAEQAALLARAAAIASGRAVVALETDSPPGFLDEQGIYRPVDVWARVLGGSALPAGRSGTSFVRIGTGLQASVLELEALDLGLAIPAGPPGKGETTPALQTVGVFLEVVMAPRGTKGDDAILRDAVQSAVARVVIEPRVGATGRASSAPPSANTVAPATPAADTAAAATQSGESTDEQPKPEDGK